MANFEKGRVLFDWDDGNLGHVGRHGVTSEEAEQVVMNDPLDIPPIQLRNGEERIAQVGETAVGRKLLVITTMRAEKIRVVTAIPASRRLRKLYFAQKGKTHARGTQEKDIPH